MRWWHALLLAGGLVLGGALLGGVYEIRMHDGEFYRFNRFTGAIDGYVVKRDGMGWFRLPNTEYPAASAPARRRVTVKELDLLDQAAEEVRQEAATAGKTGSMAAPRPQ
jgi:hypothetical protein